MLKLHLDHTQKIQTGNQIHFISLGCPRNLVDTEVMLGLLLKAGYEPTEALEDADYIVINTCGFLKASREESIETIDAATEGKKPKARVIVTGCMVQTHADEIKDQFPNVDYLLGSGDVEGILRAVHSEEQGEEITTAKSYLEAGEVPRILSTPPHYAYLKIAEGCRKRCSYCVIPDIKGPLKSKSVERILKEFRVLREGRAHEVILIAQDLGDWGKDIGYRRSTGLIHLLNEILQEEGDFWLRLLYLYPDEITDELIDVMRSDPRICPYLDMPIQHVNDTLLKAMRRKTNKKDIISTIQKLRRALPDISIRTSLIVGFPGETEEQFQELCDFVEEYPLDHVGIFTYSNEEGADSYALPNHVPEEVRKERQAILAEIQQRASERRHQRFLGRKIPVVVEGYHPESPLLMRGRHRGQCPEIDGEVVINDGREVTAFGERYLVEITDIMGYDLLGRVIKKC